MKRVVHYTFLGGANSLSGTLLLPATRIFTLITLVTFAANSFADDNSKTAKDVKSVRPDTEPIPTTLEESHQQLERQLSKEDLAKIDEMKSEEEMIQFHFGLGMNIRNGWGLWKNSKLAQYMRKLGFAHPDDMSAVILETFWCKRHGKDFRLKERANYFNAYWKAVADPPTSTRDPLDQSTIEWLFSFGAGDNKTPRQIHVGRSRKTGRFLAYEYDKGVYVPDAELQKRITELDKQK
jgi:hypothetical protein